jgi:DNA-binding NtrC family response regulator
MSKITVLFVDDEENFLNSLRRGLRQEPYGKIFAPGPCQALRILQEKDVTIVASDLKMPDMDGMTFLGEVKKRYPDIIRIAFSGSHEAVEMMGAINSGDIFRFIQKALNGLSALKEVIRQAIAYHSLCAEHAALKEESDRLRESVRAACAEMADIMISMKERAGSGRSIDDQIERMETQCRHVATDLDSYVKDPGRVRST